MDLNLPRRLDKFLADARLGTRSELYALAARGAVRVNGEPRPLAELVDPQTDRVEVDGVVVALRAPEVYALVHKPRGILTTLSDPRGRACIAALLPPDWLGQVGPVGRLDRDTTGALLVTDDGDLNHLLTHPDHHVWKRYLLTVLGEVGEDDPRLAEMRSGVALGQELTRPALCGVVTGSSRQSRTHPLTDLWMELREGKHRQVRRMASKVGLRVIQLHREAIGPVSLGALASGARRSLEMSEVDALYEAAGGREAPRQGARRALLRRLSAGELEPHEEAMVRRYLGEG